MRHLIVLLSTLINLQQLNAQNRFVNWFFAYGAGVKFSQSGPAIVNGGKTASEEGVATISDPCGNLLFYSDGTAIWTKNHSVMVNGNGLKGNIQSAEAVLIVPMPLSDSLYYVFTTDDYGGNDGVHYSIVDMSKQGGDGEVITKNIKLYGKSSEKLTAVLHANKKDYWILTHDWDNAEYKVYLLTDAGLNTTSVISKLGPTTNSSVENALGHLRPSPDGTLIASTFWYQNTLEIYGFNNSTGGLSAKYSSTQFDHNRPYSIEFSPDNKILYVGEAATASDNDIYQFEMAAFASGSNRFTVTTANYRFGNFGIGPDGKFYIAKFSQNYLGVISNPNTFGSGCNFVSNGFSLGSQQSKLGLPNPIFPIVIQNPEYAMSAIPGCKLSDPVKFELLSNFCYDSLVWDLSDFSSIYNYSRKRKLTHVYPYKGNYDITLTVYYNGKSYFYNKNLQIPAAPVVNLGKDTFFCDNFSYFLDAGNPGGSYLWHDGYIGKVRNATALGKYYVTVTVGACSGSDTMIINNSGSLNLGRDTTDCFNPVYTLTINQADSVIWNDGLKSKTRNFVSPGGNYVAKVYKGKCVKTDTILVLLPALYQNLLPSDTSLCEGETLLINAPNTSINYLWNDGSTAGSRILKNAGFYQLIQTMGNCTSKESFNLKIVPKINLPSRADTTICNGDSVYLKYNFTNTILKINGVTKSGNKHVFFQTGNYFIKAENSCFKDSVNFYLTMDSCKAMEVLFAEIFSPNGDLLNESFKPAVIGDPSKIFNYTFRIYSRWGEKLFESDKYNLGWEGKYQDKQCPVGYYLWTCNLKYLEYGEPKSLQKNGLVFIVR